MFVCPIGHCFTQSKDATCTKESQVEQGKNPQGLVGSGMCEMTVMPLLSQFGYRNNSCVSSQGETYQSESWI